MIAPHTLPSGPVHLDLAHSIQELSVSEWGERQAAVLVGRHPKLGAALERLVRFAQSESAVLLTGETGTGKELFARALYLLGSHHRKSFLRVNCAQYASEQMIASELFGNYLVTKGVLSDGELATFDDTYSGWPSRT